MNGTGNLERKRAVAVPRFEIVDKEGNVARSFADPLAAVIWAEQMWPDQSQDEDRTGKGWDAQIAGLR